MFDQTFVNVHGQTRRPWTVAISLALQTAVIAVALIVPLLHVASLDLPQKLPILLPYQKVDLKVKPEVKPAPNRTPALVRHIFPVTLSQGPTSIPRHIDMTPDAPEIANSAPTGTAGAFTRRISNGQLRLRYRSAKASSVVKPPPSLPAAPVHVRW